MKMAEARAVIAEEFAAHNADLPQTCSVALRQ
jgi:hypothetical protein